MKTTRLKFWIGAAGLALAALIATPQAIAEGDTAKEHGVTLRDINNIEMLKADFNDAKGVPRLIVLLSPT